MLVQSFEGFGIVPDETTIAPDKPYVFTFSTYTKEATIRGKLIELAAYAKKSDVEKESMGTAIVTVTPRYAMPLSAWRNQFENIGLKSLKDVYTGGVVKEEKFKFEPVKNVKVFWEPKIEAAKQGLGRGFSGLMGIVKTVAIIGGIGVVSAIALHGYMQGRGRRIISPQENPKRRRYVH